MSPPLVLSSFPLGYRTDIHLSQSDLSFLRTHISTQWFDVIKSHSPHIAEFVSNNSLSIFEYHQISNQINHSSLWPKSHRVLPSTFSRLFFQTSFYADLRSLFGSFEISDEDCLGYPNIYWRLVRPNEPADVGPLHRDSWFWELNSSFAKPNYPFTRYKVWVPIFTEPGLNGLLVEPGSHLRDDICWKGEFRHGIMKPVLLSPLSSINSELVHLSPGSCIIFDDNLIHGGSINRGDFTRVSLEFTIIARK